VPTDRGFQAENSRQRERLKALVARLGDADLERRLDHGWTVTDSLVHLAFWDLRAITLIDRFERDGVSASPIDVEAVNDTIQALGRSIPPRAAARLALDAAETVDRRIEAMSDRLIDAVGAAGHPFNLTRHVHRAEHLDAIERALG
jgi:Mycothiol maleylpyruvate isomerase N-terminal domain